jgi:hypothetical protein
MLEIQNTVMAVETFPHLIIVIVISASVWAIGWYAHLISPWADAAFGWGPHDIDSPGKIRWHRITFTALCAPVLVYAPLRYCYVRWTHRISK